MEQRSHLHRTIPSGVRQFLQSTLPFSELDEAALNELSKKCLLDVFPKGELILTQDVTEAEYLYVVQTGGVKAYVHGDSKNLTLKEYGGVGQSFDASSLLTSERAGFTVEAVEDTFCILIEKEIFIDLISSHQAFEDFYKERLSEDVILAAYSEHRLDKVSVRSEETFYLFNSRAIDMVKAQPEIVCGSCAIREVAALMADHGLTCVLIKDSEEKIQGSLTTVDIRKKVVAKGLEYSTPVEKIMNPSVVSVPGPAPSFEAIIAMMENKVDHVIIETSNGVAGIVNSADLMAHIGSSPLFLFREISSQRRVSGLHNLARKVPVIVRSLVEAGARAGNISQMLTVFTDSILERMLILIESELGPAPTPFDWLGFGSEGRKEQTFLAEQNNGLAYEESEDPSVNAAAEEYFRLMAVEVNNHLRLSGFPRSRAGNIASNDRWRQTWTTWKAYFDEWIMSPKPPDIYLSMIFFDFRSVVGRGRMARDIRRRLQMRSRRYPLFLKYFARYCLINVPPLSFYDDYLVEKDGAHTDLLDINARALSPFVDFARIMALSHGIGETNTLERLRALVENSSIPEDIYTDACHAYEYDLHLCFVHQLRTIENGEFPEYFIQPRELTELERKTLKFSFSVIEKLMEFLAKELNVSARRPLPVVAGRE